MRAQRAQGQSIHNPYLSGPVAARQPGCVIAPSTANGLRRYDNPDFNPAIGFNPMNPPDNPELPRWANLAGAIGTQFWEEGRPFNLRMPPTDFRWHVGNRQPAGTSDTWRFATDHINNPNSINAIFNLEFRPTQIKQMADGSMVPVHHNLKEGADSIGIAGASLRVFVNIGMCSDYWLTLHGPVNGRTTQKPFDIAHARANCADCRATEARMSNAEAFLKTLRPTSPPIWHERRCGIATRCWPTISSTGISCPTIAAIRSRFSARTSRAPPRPTRPRGYYRTPTIISMWATAPYLHNNALGTYIKDPSVRARMLAFQDGAERLLWPERRLGVQSIPVTSIDSELQIPGRNRPPDFVVYRSKMPPP